MKRKVLDRKLLPMQTPNLLVPFVVYMLVDYWKLPIWVFAIYMTLWVTLLLMTVCIASWGTESVTPKEFQ